MSIPALGPLIARGRTAEVYAWQEGQILKLFYDWCPDGMIQHEIDVGRIVSTGKFPVPKLIQPLEINGRRGIVYERADGSSMLDLWVKHPWLLVRLARQMAELHAHIHLQDGSGLPSLKSALTATIQRVENLPSGLKADVLRLLENLPDGSALCHFDFHPGQVLITKEGPVIIDWMTACQGYPLADVARSIVILTYSPVPGAGWIMQTIVNLWRGLFYRTYLARYLALHPGVTRDEITTWMVPVAAGRLNEAIPGEEEPLLRFITAHLPRP
jgi:hypothetical protein